MENCCGSCGHAFREGEDGSGVSLSIPTFSSSLFFLIVSSPSFSRWISVSLTTSLTLTFSQSLLILHSLFFVLRMSFNRGNPSAFLALRLDGAAWIGFSHHFCRQRSILPYSTLLALVPDTGYQVEFNAFSIFCLLWISVLVYEERERERERESVCVCVCELSTNLFTNLNPNDPTYLDITRPTYTPTIHPIRPEMPPPKQPPSRPTIKIPLPPALFRARPPPPLPPPRTTHPKQKKNVPPHFHTGMTARSIKFYDGTYPLDERGFWDERGGELQFPFILSCFYLLFFFRS